MTTEDPASHADERQVRLTEREALANVRTVLHLRGSPPTNLQGEVATATAQALHLYSS